jgi:hypothetical protein
VERSRNVLTRYSREAERNSVELREESSSHESGIGYHFRDFQLHTKVMKSILRILRRKATCLYLNLKLCGCIVETGLEDKRENRNISCAPMPHGHNMLYHHSKNR